MTEVDQVLVEPTGPALEAALAAAAAALNRRARERRLLWPPGDWQSFTEELAAAPEGYRKWNGGDDRPPGRPYGRGGLVRSALAVAWWSDHVGRKHVRLLGRRGKLGVPQLARLMWPEMPRRHEPLTPVPLLALVYRDFTFLPVRAGQRRVQVVCRCGVSGEPGAVGWMGDCCGPCHDRRQSGESEPPAVAGAFVFRPEGGVRSLAFTPDGERLLVGAGQRLLVWDIGGGRELLALPCDGDIFKIAPAADGSALAAVGYHRAWVWDGLPDTPRPPDFRPPDATSPVALAADGSALAVGQGVGLGMKVFRRPASRGWGSVGPEASAPEVAWRGEYVTDLVFAPGGRALAASVYGGGRADEVTWSVRLWDVAAAQPLPRRLPVGRNITCLAFAPDGRTLAVGTGGSYNPPAGETDHVEVWDVNAAARTAALGPHDGVVTGVGPLPGGRNLLSADNVGASVRLWDVTAEREEAAFEWHQHYLISFALSPDGRWLATGDLSGTVRLWPVEALCRP